MSLLQLLLLSVIQGLTEFLPISSSAHLILVPYLGDFPDQGLGFDAAVHLGSLFAVLIYFRHQVLILVTNTSRRFFLHTAETHASRLGWHLIIATVPIVLIGALVVNLAMSDLRNPVVIALASILFGLLLWYSDSRARFTPTRTLDTMSTKDALVIGFMQALAIVPGSSRSGITITGGLLLGFDRQSAARFSFLLAIPTIILSALLLGYKLIVSDNPVNWNDMLLGGLISFCCAWLAIHYFLKLIDKTGMLPYVIYRILLGIALLYIAYPYTYTL